MPVGDNANEATESPQGQPIQENVQQGADVMPEQTQDPTVKRYPHELKLLIDRAEAGDETVLPALRKALADHPEMALSNGDVVAKALDALLTLSCGSNLFVKESIRCAANQLRQDLLVGTTSKIEQLLVDRIVLSWVSVHFEEYDLAMRTPALLRTNHRALQAAQRSLDKAHARHQAAIRSLATVQRLMRPFASPIALAQKAVTEGPLNRPAPADFVRRPNRTAETSPDSKLTAASRLGTLDCAMN
jgi:hypothetical protein